MKQIMRIALMALVAVPMVLSTSCAEKKEKEEQEKPRKKYLNSEIHKLQVANVTAERVHHPNQGNYYYASYMVDGNPSTAWSVDVNVYPYNMEYVDAAVFHFEKPVRLAYVMMMNGYGKSAERFYQNARLAQVQFLNPDYTSGGSNILYNGPVEDNMSMQKLTVQRMSEANRAVNSVVMRIPYPHNGGTIHGRNWNDLCVSEVEFWGWEEKEQ